MEILDLIVIGAGPAGLAAAVEAKRGGLKNVLVLEKGASHSSMIRTYYKEGKRVDAQYGGVQAICFGVLCLRDGNRESYLQFMDHVIKEFDLRIEFNTEVWKLSKRDDGLYRIHVGNEWSYSSKFIVVAIGKMGKPKQPEYYREISLNLKNNGSILFDINRRALEHKKVLVVGGGDSAVEYADILAEKNEVTLSYRQKEFQRANFLNQKIIADLISSNKIRAHLGSNIVRIENDDDRPRMVFKESEFPSETYDAVLYGLGGMTPIDFLKNMGVDVGAGGDITLSSTKESSLPGIYVVGDLLGKKQGGGSIIAGFNSATVAIRDILERHLQLKAPPEVVLLDHQVY